MTDYKMTREEAIARLEANRGAFVFKETNEALDMAIEALKILGDDGIVNCCGCIHWKTDGGAMMMCELWNTPMGDFDYCSYGKREKPTIPTFAESAEAYKAWTGEEMGGGRLIDADFEEQHYTSMLLNPSPDVTAKDRENAKIILGALKMAKTVSADRPNGEWTDVNGDGSLWRCDQCKDTACCKGNYCPNCGARMTPPVHGFVADEWYRENFKEEME